MRLSNNQLCQVVVLWKEDRELGGLVEWSVVYSSTAADNVVDDKKTKLSDQG